MTIPNTFEVTFTQYSHNFFSIGFKPHSNKKYSFENLLSGIIVNREEFDINFMGEFKSFSELTEDDCTFLKKQFNLEYFELYELYRTLLLIHEIYFEEHFNLSLEESHSGCYQITI